MPQRHVNPKKPGITRDEDSPHTLQEALFCLLLSVLSVNSNGNFITLNVCQKCWHSYCVLCVGQLLLVTDFIARIFNGSEHAVKIYRKIHCFSKRMSDNIHLLYLIIFQYCLQIPSCVLDAL